MKTFQLCPECSNRITVLNTIRGERYRVQYRGCRKCGYRPPENKNVIPVANSSLQLLSISQTIVK